MRIERADGVAEDGVGGAGGGREFRGAEEGFEALGMGEGEDVGGVGADDGAREEFGLAGVVEGVGEDGFAEEGAEGFVGQADGASAGHDDGEDLGYGGHG